MVIIDANVVLRYLLDDIEEQAVKATEILENHQVYIPNEIIAEVVYVLEKVYKIERLQIRKSLDDLISYDNIQVDNEIIIQNALELFAKRRLDFVDTLLFAYNKVEKYEVATFDEKLKKLLDGNNQDI